MPSVEAQLSRHEVHLARHDERLDTLDSSHDETKQSVKGIADKMDRSERLVVSTLLGVVGILIKLLLFKA